MQEVFSNQGLKQKSAKCKPISKVRLIIKISFCYFTIIDKNAIYINISISLDYYSIFQYIMQKRQKKRQNKDVKRQKEKKREENHDDQDQQEGPKLQQKAQTPEFSLYDLLEVSKESSNEEIKKQYRKLVLKYHPDKNPEPQARQKFQKIKEAYDILIDAQKRKEYDQFGTIGDQFNNASFKAAYNYFRNIYKPITKNQIEQFEKTYCLGPEEEEDLVDYYNSHQGDMKALLESIPLSKNQDLPRFIMFYEKKIESKQLKKYKIFDQTKNKIRSLQDQSKEFKQEQDKGLSALVLAIKGKGNNQKDFISQLQQKYGLGKKIKKEKKGKQEKSKSKNK